MPKITVLPHEALCPDGAVIDARSGQSICDALLDNHIEIEHACGKCGACSTCHVIIRKGFSSLSEMSEKEEEVVVEENVMELREKQTFWAGVVRGVIGSAVFFAGLVTLIYYVVRCSDC